MSTHNILIVDDEKNVLNSLERLLRREHYNVLVSTSGREALEILKSSPVELIISDQNMPGMTGVEFLSQAKKITPDAIRIMLTGYADINAAVAAINDGDISKFFYKPWNDIEIKSSIRQLLDHYQLRKENRELNRLIKAQNEELRQLNEKLEGKVRERTKQIERAFTEIENLNKDLERSFFEIMQVFMELMSLYDPYSAAHAKRVLTLAQSVGERFFSGADEIRALHMSALLHDLGKMGIHKSIINKEEKALTPEERKILREHPILGEVVLKNIKSLERIAPIIRHHHESFDGRGYPDGLHGKEIPLGSRIIAVCDLYDHTVHKRNLPNQSFQEEAIFSLKKNCDVLLDGEVVNEFLNHLRKHENVERKVIEVALHELAEGMILVEDLYTAKGIFLMKKGITFSQSHINRILSFNKIDPIVQKILVYESVH